MAHVKRRVKMRQNGDGTVVRTTVYQADLARARQRGRPDEGVPPQGRRRTVPGRRAAPPADRRLRRPGPRADAVPHGGRAVLWLGVWRPRTRQSATEKLRYAIEHFGDRPIATIRKGDVQSFLSALARDLAPNTIRIVRQHLAASFDAPSMTVDRVNPCKGVRVPKAERSPVIPLTSDQARA